MKLPASSPRPHDETGRKSAEPARLALSLLLIATVCYLLPWVGGPGVALTLGGYDLAEWASLHPAARAASLATPLLLRLPSAFIIVMLALLAGQVRFSRAWWGALTIVIAGFIALLPPLEFFTIFRDDPNYGQQWRLALLALAGSLIGLSGIVNRPRWPLFAGLALAGCAAIIGGVAGALDLMRGLGLPVTIGVGAGTTLGAFALLGLYSAWISWRKTVAWRRVISHRIK